SDDATRQVKPGSADPARTSGGAAEVSHAPSSGSHASEAARAARDVLAGGGEMGALVRNLDWSDTPLGPLESWPQSLRSAVSICLGSGFPIAVYWGPELALLYNDAWSPI